jgi:hypothetical protein
MELLVVVLGMVQSVQILRFECVDNGPIVGNSISMTFNISSY